MRGGAFSTLIPRKGGCALNVPFRPRAFPCATSG